jgi:hypothetical protein
VSKRIGDPGYAPGWCIHYRAGKGGGDPMPKTCEAGVEYASFRAENFNLTFAQQPCFLTKAGESKPDAVPCKHLRRPTPEEIKAHEGWLNARWDKMRVVMTAIDPWRQEHQKANKGGAQTIDCPACGGSKTLSMTIAGVNGHVHAHCKTEGCVSWME